MAYYYRSSKDSSVLEAFTLSPMPYPVLLTLLVVSLLLGASWFFSYEEFMEEAEEQMSWALLLLPVLLVLVIKWVSSIERLDDVFFGLLPAFDGRPRPTYYYANPQLQQQQAGGGSSPWGVAAAVLLLLVLAYFHSTFQDMWGP